MYAQDDPLGANASYDVGAARQTLLKGEKHRLHIPQVQS
jgi:hypothetical protein